MTLNLLHTKIFNYLVFRNVQNFIHMKIFTYTIGPRPRVDVLIGLDCADLHFSFRDVRGAPGQPVARLTPLDWTCTGPVGNSEQISINTNFAHTYFSAGQADMEKINAMLQKFWEVDTSGTEQVSLLKFEDKLVLDMESIEYK